MVPSILKITRKERGGRENSAPILADFDRCSIVQKGAELLSESNETSLRTWIGENLPMPRPSSAE
jgi:hypothetical protein